MDNRMNLKEFFASYSEIRIPRIQRAYAQGRKNEFFIRDSILGDIFMSLAKNDTLELNYVYGTKNSSNSFELLDGQQRVTTLFLLHWYIACRENRLDNKLMEMLAKFRYETRHTSSDFCEALSKYPYVRKDGEIPSQTIRKQFKWYFKSFDLDSTIDSMLRMLDAIDVKYNEISRNDLFDSLDNIVFYVLPLEEFGLSEELYIKMNARGLELTPFENFKADLINYMKNSGEFNDIVEYNGHKMPHYLCIASELDGKWVDLFWDDDDYKNIDKSEYDEDNEDYSVKYFRFFYRYFASTFILKYATDIKSEPMRQEKNYLFFHQLSEQQKLHNYYRFTNYKTMLVDHPDYLLSLEKVLNALFEHYKTDIKPLLRAPWGEDDDWDFFTPDKLNGFTLRRRIVFAAVCEYIEAYETFNIETFKKWMRIVWNVVNNTDIDSISPATYLERGLSSIIRGAADSGEEFYHFLARYNSRGDDDDNGGERSKSITEEIIKARYIDSDDRWLSLFEEAERHPFCKGMVRFFLRDEGDTPENFAHRYVFIQKIFDGNGVTAEFSSEANYVLLRAMISCITNWNNLGNRYFTDKVERKYNALKVMLTTPTNQCIRDFMCDALDLPTIEDVKQYLYDATQRDSQLNVLNMNAIWAVRCVNIHKKLYHDEKYMRWMQEHNAFRVFWRYGYYYAVEYGSSYNLVLLESERDEYVNHLIIDEGFECETNQSSSLRKNQVEEFNEYGLYFGYYVYLKKEIKGWIVRLVFSTDCKLNVSVECPESEKNQLMEVYGEAPDLAIEGTEPVRRFIYKGIPYQDDVTYEDIHNALFGEDGVITKLPERKTSEEINNLL